MRDGTAGNFVLGTFGVWSRCAAFEVPHKHELGSEMATVRNLAVRLLLRAGSEEMSAAVRRLDRHVELPRRLLALA